jgi:hypothetical protein
MFYESNFTIGVNNASLEIPEMFSLSQNFPNPFNPVTKIKYTVPKLSDVRLVLYDVLGRAISELVNQKQSPGVYETVLDVSSLKYGTLPSGIYFYRLTAGNYSDTKRMILIK